MTRSKYFAVGFKIDIRICLDFQTANDSVSSVTSCSKYCARFEQKKTERTEMAVPRMDDAVEVLCRRLQDRHSYLCQFSTANGSVSSVTFCSKILLFKKCATKNGDAENLSLIHI